MRPHAERSPASVLADALGHHAWATLRIIDVCATLDTGQLQSDVPGTYGSIIDTLRHLVSADRSYLHVLTNGGVPTVDKPALAVDELRLTAEEAAAGWADLLSTEIVPSRVLTRHRPDGSATHAPVSVRLAQALHHGTDHRSQICTALTNLGIDPPTLDVWEYAWECGTLIDTRRPLQRP